MAKVLLVTGASRGIGAATAKLGAARGFDVCVNYNSNGALAEAVVKDIRASGRAAVAVQADTSQEQDVVRLFKACDRELGPVSALVNNAGITGGVALIEEVNAHMLRELMEINIVGYFLCAKEAVKRMSTARGGTGGAIVNVSSRAADLGGANEWIHYAASRGATDTMTRGMSIELGKKGIRVNAVQPGIIDTDIHATGLPARMEKSLPNIPIGRVGQAQEVAETILWLLSDQASYVTGAIVNVSGGR
ncbi:MAG: SDR family oxidoreductase [Burkholderiales bacterium]|nr:SDR family oxidoreductase [Pseudomonadota bacterium]